MSQHEGLADMERMRSQIRRLAWFGAFVISVAMAGVALYFQVGSIVAIMTVAGIPGGIITFGALVDRWPTLIRVGVSKSRTGLWVLLLTLLIGGMVAISMLDLPLLVGAAVVLVWVCEYLIAASMRQFPK